MDELDRTEELPRDDHTLPPLSVTRAARGTRERLPLPPPLPARAKRWTATSLATPAPPEVAKEISPSGGFTLHPASPPVGRAPTMPPIPAAARRPAPAATASGVLTSPPADDETAPLRRSRPVPVVPAPRGSRPLAAVVPEDKPVVPAPDPSLTEELQLLTAAEVEPGEPTAYYDRQEDAAPRSRRWLVIGGTLVVVAILAIVVVAGSSAASSSPASPASLPTPAPAKAVATVVPAPAPPPATAPAPAPAPARAPAAAPAPAATPPPAPPPATAPAPALRTRELAVTTIPAGASVTLIDDGAATVVGKTPIKTTLAKTRGYDLVFALPGHQTAVYHLAPDEQGRLTVDLRSVAAPKPRRR